MIFTTAYTSRMKPLSDQDMSELLAQSRSRNAVRGVTGLLMYRNGRVLQMLEGPEGSVRDLYDRIVCDVRHDNVTTVWTGISGQRRFPDWSMGFDDLQQHSEHRAAAVEELPDRGLRGQASDDDSLSRPSVDQPGARAGSGDPQAVSHDRVEASLLRKDAPRFDHDLSIAYAQRRNRVLRRALATGDRLIVALGIILNGHDPVDVAGGMGVEPHLRCRICSPSGDAVLDAYPCATAKNAIWALEAVGPR